ncbi:tRNA (adenosine(37)-N6)-threonylcarbamoyltransferase complex ATPase subunit type 1 TsaE [Nocardioides nematodiphilus]|uniref:tRNA (adenosine(37)-N6)-threonylcarbamoyltransferase complex ATPase subunit type 1 TsaE n=1 Tax=Nocardioides nematodiphilus TaxID=2849669 RepID=UPI001CDA5399|nr:tRNA (adenosine(37)-N6)-threonylcarbamoyltransferase complex ATPase subunit type 1 TsaE [Nocardioides nematodiphilus]MCA1981301.1 tRNA (adenosine(37)-N6)-threonylcarbamoyltransferase complex ATPase subunit type 1 TsaE [Nocardioides nematodiphilus]
MSHQPDVEVTVRRVGPEAAADVLRIVLAAFGERPPLDPPADALHETVESIAIQLASHGGLIAEVDGEPAGTLIFDPVGRTVFLRRFAVLPDRQHHGIAHVMINTAVTASDGFDDLTVVAREELPRTVRFWQRAGFREIAHRTPYVELRRPLRTHVEEVSDAEEMRDLGRTLAKQLRAGDLLVLSGELGAGKTTFTQGLGEGLGVRGAVTSPTFVIARVHPSEIGGPDLVHVDAYRLGGMAELDDLDLDTDLDDAVTVVEWGAGLAEGLAESRLEIRIVRALTIDELEGDEDPRRVEITPVGPRWHDLHFDDFTGERS